MHLLLTAVKLLLMTSMVYRQNSEPFTWVVHAQEAGGPAARASGLGQERLYHLDLKHPVFLPQVQHSHQLTLHIGSKGASRTG